MPSIGRKFKTFLTRKMGPKPTERKEIDFSFVPSAHEDYRKNTTNQQMSLNRREMRINDNIAKIKFDLLKMRMESGEMLERCNQLDCEALNKTSFTSDQLSPLDNQDELDEFSDLLSICSDEELDPESPNPCRGGLQTTTSNENIESIPDNQSTSPVTDISDLNSTASERSPAKESLDESPNLTPDRSIYRSPKTIPGSAVHIGVEKCYSENDCPPVLGTRYSLYLPERPHSSLMDYIHTHSSQRHLAYAKMIIPTMTHTNSETIFEKSFSKAQKSFATEVFEEIKKSIGDLSISQTK